ASGRARRPRAAGALGCGGADAAESTRPLRTLDPRSQGRDLLLRLRRPLGPRRCARRAARRPRSVSRRRGDLVRRGGGMKSKWVLALVVGVLGVVAYAGTVLATPPRGVVTTTFAVGRFD